MLGSEGRLEPVIVDHVNYRADREVKGNSYDQSHYAGADVFVKERVLWPERFKFSDDETGVTGVGVSCSQTRL